MERPGQTLPVEPHALALGELFEMCSESLHLPRFSDGDSRHAALRVARAHPGLDLDRMLHGSEGSEGTCLSACCENGRSSTAEALLALGAAPDPLEGPAPLALACASKEPGSTRCVELLLAHGARPDGLGPRLPLGITLDGFVPLEKTLEGFDGLAKAKLLLEHGANPNAPYRGMTILSCAAIMNRRPQALDILKLALASGADPDGVPGLVPPLFWAIRHENTPALRSLIAAGASFGIAPTGHMAAPDGPNMLDASGLLLRLQMLNPGSLTTWGEMADAMCSSLWATDRQAGGEAALLHLTAWRAIRDGFSSLLMPGEALREPLACLAIAEAWEVLQSVGPDASMRGSPPTSKSI